MAYHKSPGVLIQELLCKLLASSTVESVTQHYMSNAHFDGLQSRGQDEEDGGNGRQVGENFGICKNCLILCMCNMIILKMIRATRETNKTFLQGIRDGRLIFHHTHFDCLVKVEKC